MPIYEYKCQECQSIFEVIATSTKGADKVECSKCGSDKVKKTISASSYRISSGGSSTTPSGALCGGSCKSGFS
jgi:putative FmdB family regulatory protein